MAQPPEGADDLVGDEQDAMAVADFADALEVARRRGETAAGVLHGLEVDGGHRVGALAHNGPFDLVGGPSAEGHLVVGEDLGPVEVRVGHLDRPGHQRLEGSAQLGDAGDGERPHGGAVVGDVAADHLRALGLTGHAEVLAGQFPGRLDRFGTARGEEDAVEVAGRVAGDPLGQLDRPGVGIGPQREVGQRLACLAPASASSVRPWPSCDVKSPASPSR